MADLFERQLAALSPWGDVLVCGGGALPPGDGGRPIAARRVIVMEPDPGRQAALARALRDDPAVELLPVMAGAAYAKTELTRYNFGRVAARRAPAGIREVFPGLQVRDRIEVRIADVADIARRIRREPGYRNLLILATPGEEAEILSRLQESGRLGVFDHILLPLPEKPLYEGAAAAAQLTALLDEAGFAPMTRDDAGADVPQGHFYRPSEMQAALASRGTEIEAQRQRAVRAEAALTRARDAAEAEREAERLRGAAELGRVRAEATRLAAQVRVLQSLLGTEAGS